jgi:hypothetical protein
VRVIHNNETNLIEHTHGVMLPNLEGRVLEEIQKFLHVERLVPIDVKMLEDLHQRLFASHARIMNQTLELHRNLIRASSALWKVDVCAYGPVSRITSKDTTRSPYTPSLRPESL